MQRLCTTYTLRMPAERQVLGSILGWVPQRQRVFLYIYRGPGFLADVSFGYLPTPFLLLP
jgi:hypothetical protein